MSTHSDGQHLLPNLMRVMPYTAYISVGSYAVVFACSEAGWLFSALMSNEVLNFALKKGFVMAASGSELLQRPKGAMDSGIFPQHFPMASTSSGMPSGHSQTSAFLATVLTHKVLQNVSCHVSSCWPQFAVSLGYVWSVAVLVMLSRTRFAGIFSVRISGRPVAHHTVLQVLAGACIGATLGHAASLGRPGLCWLWMFCVEVVVLALLARIARGRAKTDREDQLVSEASDSELQSFAEDASENEHK